MYCFEQTSYYLDIFPLPPTIQSWLSAYIQKLRESTKCGEEHNKRKNAHVTIGMKSFSELKINGTLTPMNKNIQIS